MTDLDDLCTRAERILPRWQECQEVCVGNCGERPCPCSKADDDPCWHCFNAQMFAEAIEVTTSLLAALTQLRTERDRLHQLVTDILMEHGDDGTACDQCGPVVLCSLHSILSALAGRTWTSGRLERERASQPPQEG